MRKPVVGRNMKVTKITCLCALPREDRMAEYEITVPGRIPNDDEKLVQAVTKMLKVKYLDRDIVPVKVRKSEWQISRRYMYDIDYLIKSLPYDEDEELIKELEKEGKENE